MSKKKRELKKRKSAVMEIVPEKEEQILTHAFIIGDEILSAEDLIKTPEGKNGFATMQKSGHFSGDLMGRGVSRTPTKQVTQNVFGQPQGTIPSGDILADLVEPPFDPLILSKFLEVDEIHFRCVKTKVSDILGRGFSIVNITDDESISPDVIKHEIHLVKDFIKNANEHDTFRGVFHQGGMDHEGTGWTAIEVVRSMDRRILHLNHLPAHRIKVLEGFKGFVELRRDGNKQFFQPFGRKVVSTFRRDVQGRFESFDITKDLDWDNSQWSLRDRETYDPTDDLVNSANELLFIPKHHPKSIHYGVPDFIPAVGYILANINIRDFFLQFFEHNTVPQYAVIIKGANLDENVKNLIMSYFSKEVRGSQHRTLVIPIPAVGGDVEVTFERLETTVNIQAYEGTRKSNQVSIMVAHGVNPAIIGIADTPSLGSGKGTAQMENYRERIVEPGQIMWAEVINNLLQKGLGLFFVGIKFDPLGVEERSRLLEDDLKTVKQGGMTINQMRKRNKLGDDIVGGNRAFIMTNAGPIFIDQLEAPDASSVLDKMGMELEEMATKMQLLGEKEELAAQKIKEEIKEKKQKRLQSRTTRTKNGGNNNGQSTEES